MSDDQNAAVETAKAVQETAKAVPAVVEAGSELGRWFSRVVGTVPEDFIGLALGDYLHDLRLRNLDRIRRRTDEILRARGVTDPRPIGPKTAIPAFEAASEESDEELQRLWANLLANAMDPNEDVALMNILINTLKKMEPLDALALDMIGRTDETLFGFDDLKKSLNIRESLSRMEIMNLANLGLLREHGKQRGNYYRTPLMTELYLAVSDR